MLLRRPPWRGLLIGSGLVLVVLAAGLAVLHAWLNSEAVRDKVLARVRPALESRLGPVSLGSGLYVGWTGTLVLGPVELPGSRPGEPPVVRIERVTVHPRRLALLAGRAEASQVVLQGVRVEAGRQGQALLELLERVLQARAARRRSPARAEGPSRALPELVLEDVRLAYERRQRVEWGPLSARLRVEGSGEAPRVVGSAELPGGGTAALSLERGERGLGGRVQVQRASAGMLLSLAGPPLRLEGGTLEAALQVEGSGATFSLTVRGLTVESPQLAPEPVGPLAFGVEGHVGWEGERQQVELDSLRLTLGRREQARVEVRGQARLRREPHFTLQAELEPLSFEEALEALPAALVPGTELEQLEGSFRASLSLSGPVRQPREWEVKAKLDLSELKRSARAGPLAWLREPFDYRPLTAEGRGRALHVGPSNPDFVPLAEVPRPLVRAVLLSEDAGFFGHRGFDFDSLKDNLLAPRDEVVRGGSTLTQQLAKNLFLSREKTYARKVKEAYLTLGLEASVPKERLLEVYFNIIEWGPGLYGIGEAARHYFGKEARALSVREAAFLATIIPNPVRYHGYCSRGTLTEVWEQRLATLLGKLYAAGDITEAEHQEALGAPLVFTHSGAREDSAEAAP